MSTTTPSILFEPSAPDTERLLTLMNDEAYSLADIASGANTSIEALTCWLARPDIAQRLANLESAAARRTRLVAGNRMMFVVTTLARILEEYNQDEYKNPYQHGPHGHELKRRAHETARKAAALLFRLSRYHPASSPPAARTQRPESAAPANDSASSTAASVSQTPALPELNESFLADLTALLSRAAASKHESLIPTEPPANNPTPAHPFTEPTSHQPIPPSPPSSSSPRPPQPPLPPRLRSGYGASYTNLPPGQKAPPEPHPRPP